MAVTLTVNDLSLALRITTHLETPALPYSDILDRQLAAASAIVESYAPAAPDENLNEAVIMLVGHLLQQPPHSRAPENAFILSGARALLGPWSVPKSTTVT